MKNKTAAAKNLLAQAIREMPDDEALNEAKATMRRALTQIDHVEDKRVRRATTQTAADNWWAAVRAGTVRLAEGLNSHALRTDVSARLALKNLDRMIQVEQDKIEAMSNRPAPTTRRRKGDDGDVQPIHG